MRFSEHAGTAIQPCQANTSKPVSYTYADMAFLPIEKVRVKDRFVLEAREAFWIRKYASLKQNSEEEIEHGLNMKK